MKTAILSNGINWTKKKTIYHTSRIKFYMKGRQRSKYNISKLIGQKFSFTTGTRGLVAKLRR